MTHSPSDHEESQLTELPRLSARAPGASLAGALRQTDGGLARGLGWFSIGLGLAELLAPRRLGRAIGVGHHPVLLPLLGLREIGSGIGILGSGGSAGTVRSRVYGDAMDLALLGYAFASKPWQRGRIAAAVAAVLGVTALDVLCSKQRSQM